MPFSEYEFGIDDDLWESAVRAGGFSNPSEHANLALRQMLDQLKRQRDDTDNTAP